MPLSTLPSRMSSIEIWLAGLAAYRCDMLLLGESGTVPLWSQDSGFDAGGIDMIVQRCRAWHERGRKQRQIKCGDRVAVLGHGIAVVERADNDLVQAVLSGENVLSIERPKVVWDKRNARWETAPGASMSSTVRRN